MPDDVSVVTLAERVDGLGQRHVRYQQQAYGLPVAGGDLVAHYDATDRRIGVSGIEAEPFEHPDEVRADARLALATAVDALAIDGATVGEAELTYVATPDGETRLAWAAPVAYRSEAQPHLDIVFVSAVDGTYLTRHPQIHTALSRRVYTANNQEILPGTLLLQEGGTTGDTSAQTAYDNLAIVHDYYVKTHGRDSFDGNGAQLRATVHFGQAYGNAFWNGQQMAYGDGDGQYLGNTALSFDIVAHELTHAVTQHTANLVYENESGALNEAWSDIMGAAADAHRRGGITAETWLLAEDVWTPGTAGDAMRYLDDPTRDGISYDYYPERYRGTEDYGGVHINSGIANLAFSLLVKGGDHPRAKTPYAVPSLGLEAAEQIFYRALTTYMTPNTNFQGARVATAQAATDLYGADAANAVHYAWDAVGVNGTPTRAPVALAIESPADGADVKAGFVVATRVAEGDDFDIARAALYVDGALAGEVSAPPYEFTTDASLGLGQVTLEVKTFDRSGNERTDTATANVVPGGGGDDGGGGTGPGGDSDGDGVPDPTGPATGDFVGGCSTSPGTGLGSLGLVLLALVALTRRRW